MLAVGLQKELQQLARREGLRFLAGFGSSVSAARSPRDVDLALMPDQGWLEPESGGLWRRWARQLGRGDLDLIWLPSASWQLCRQVALHGVPLYESRQGVWRSFQTAAHLRASASDPWRYLEREYLARFLQGRLPMDIDLVRHKANLIGHYLRDLEDILQKGRESFEGTPLHYSGERLTELLVECAAWINTEVSQAVAGIPPSDYYSSFFSLARAGWIGAPTAQHLAECARLRNALVHHYEELSVETLYDRLLSSLPHWRSYLESIASRL